MHSKFDSNLLETWRNPEQDLRSYYLTLISRSVGGSEAEDLIYISPPSEINIMTIS